MKFHEKYRISDLDQKINELQTYRDHATTYVSIFNEFRYYFTSKNKFGKGCNKQPRENGRILVLFENVVHFKTLI